MAKEQKTAASPSADTSKTKIKVQGLIFEASKPYAEGYVLNALEAKTLNQTRDENLRNNFAKTVKDLLAGIAKDTPEGTTPRELSVEEISDLQTKFAAYDASYSFAERRAAAPVDPIEKIAHGLAWEHIKAKLKEKNYDIKTVTPEKKEELIASLLAKDSAILEEAKRRVESSKNIASSALDDLLA